MRQLLVRVFRRDPLRCRLCHRSPPFARSLDHPDRKTRRLRRHLSDDPDDAYFAHGLTDDLITDLSKIHGLFIIARNSVFAYKDRAVDIPDVARELGVRYVLEGSVRRAGEHVRINAQLIDGSTGGHVWAERYDREYADIFAVQDMVISEIVDALSVQLTQSEQTQVMRLPTGSLEAYDYYLRAEQELHSPAGDAGLFRALELYEEAIKLDDEFADAYAGSARAAAYLWVNSHDAYLAGALARERVYATAGRALTLNPQLPRAHAVLAEAQVVSGEHEAATVSARRAVDLGPSNAEAHATLAWVLAYAGEPAAAVQAAQTALRLDPKPPATVLLTAGLAFFLDHRYEPAIQALEQANDLAPDLNEAPEFLAMAYARRAGPKRPRRMPKPSLRISPAPTCATTRSSTLTTDDRRTSPIASTGCARRGSPHGRSGIRIGRRTGWTALVYAH